MTDPARAMHLRIDMVGPYPPFVGGTASFLSRLVPALEERGVSCRVFNTRRGDPGRGAVERTGRFLLFLGLSLRAALSRSDIVHCHAVNWANLLGHAMVLAAARLAGKPVVLTLHAGDLQACLSRGGKGGMLARFILGLPRAVTTVTPELREVVLRLAVRNVSFVANDLDFAAPGATGDLPLPPRVVRFAADRRPLLVCVGAMQRVHGIESLVEAVALLRDEFPGLGLILIAYKSVDTGYRHAVEARIAELNLGEAVHFSGPIPDVQAVVALADVFVRPALSDGDSIAVREALAVGVPVVASRVGYRPEGVALFSPGDHGEMADLIARLLGSQEKGAVKTRPSGQEAVSRYIDLYEAVMARPRS